MQVTRRWKLSAGFGLVLCALGTLSGRLLPLIGGVGIGAWLIVSAVAATRQFERLADDMTVTYDLSATDAYVDTELFGSLMIQRQSQTATTPLTADVSLPPGVREVTGDRTASLEVGELTAETTFGITVPIAGRVVFPQPEIQLSDSFELYREQIQQGPSPSVRVRARGSSIHVGQGGDPTRNAYGEHATDTSGPGITVRDIREYTVGDAFKQIDWKTTARLGDPYVRETEGETNQQLVLVVDHRGEMARGRDGETMLDYAREVGLGIAESAEQINDPLGLRTVGSVGITTTIAPETTPQTYDQITSRLIELEPTASGADAINRSVRRSRQIYNTLSDDDDAFASVLRAYVGETDTYVQRLRDDPLAETVRRIRSEFGTDTWPVIVTSDADPVRLREAVDLATSGGGHVLVFLTPQCLFAPTGITDLDAAYKQYLAFEELRRELDSHPRVTAFEVAPGDRLDALLANRRSAQRATP